MSNFSFAELTWMAGYVA